MRPLVNTYTPDPCSPCPFCGGEELTVIQEGTVLCSADPARVSVACCDCGARGPCDASEQGAVRAWDQGPGGRRERG